MIVSLIVAASENNVIGKDNQLPWHLPADLKHFKDTTMGHPILMGRKTFESIGKPLPGRTNIIISRQEGYQACGALVAPSIEKALELCEDKEEAFIIGGASIYQQALPIANKVYLTRVHTEVDGDAFWPELNSNWQEAWREDHPASDTNPYAYSFIVLNRN